CRRTRLSMSLLLRLGRSTTPFVIPCFDVPRAIHSFPTRRSSDLWGSVADRATLRADFDQVAAWSAANRRPVLLGEFGAYDKSGRSEEHTSELQSRGHLVCRFLLEKKDIHTLPSLLWR